MKEPQGKNTHVIYGLEAFDFERPWVAWKSESMLKPVNLNTWFNDIQTDMRTQLTTLKLIAHAIWQSVAVMLLLYFLKQGYFLSFPQPTLRQLSSYRVSYYSAYMLLRP